MHQLERNILSLYGDMGQKWLAALPVLLAKYAQYWGLEISAPFENLSYNYAAPAYRADGRLAVIKAGFPSDELRAEMTVDQEFMKFSIKKLDPKKPLW